MTHKGGQAFSFAAGCIEAKASSLKKLINFLKNQCNFLVDNNMKKHIFIGHDDHDGQYVLSLFRTMVCTNHGHLAAWVRLGKF